jgi:HD superfamily phosphohydrolase
VKGSISKRCQHKPFRGFLESILRNDRISPGPLVKLIDPDFVAEAIIGYWGSRPRERFLIEIINGPLDADKLDYLARDAQFAGLSVVYDFNRYLVTIGYHEEKHVSISRSKKRGKGPSLALRLPLRGATALEQILISKMMLYSYMYHHQKVVAAESMILEMFEPLSAGGYVECGGKTIAHPVDVLALTDDAVEGMLYLNVKTSDAMFARIGHRVSSRDLLKRALTVSRLFVDHLTDRVESPEKKEAAAAFTLMDMTLRNPTERSEFREALYQRTLRSLDHTKSEGLKMCDVVVAWPKQPDMSEAADMMVPLGDTGEVSTSVQKLFPLKEWTESYSSNQWKGYIFAPSGYRSEVRDAALELISERFGVALAAEASRVCGIPDFDTEMAPPP